MRDQTYRSAISELDDGIELFLNAKKFPDFEFLVQYLPNIECYAWRTYYSENEIRRDKSGNWGHLSLVVESPPEFLEFGGLSYTKGLAANMETTLDSLKLYLGMVDPDEWDSDEEDYAIENQREWAELISEMSTFRDGLKSLKISTSSRAPESDVHLLHDLMSPSLVQLDLSKINGAELEMIISWDVPQLRRIEVTLEAQTDWKIASPQNVTGFRAGCSNWKRSKSKCSLLETEPGRVPSTSSCGFAPCYRPSAKSLSGKRDGILDVPRTPGWKKPWFGIERSDSSSINRGRSSLRRSVVDNALACSLERYCYVHHLVRTDITPSMLDGGINQLLLLRSVVIVEHGTRTRLDSPQAETTQRIFGPGNIL